MNGGICTGLSVSALLLQVSAAGVAVAAGGEPQRDGLTLTQCLADATNKRAAQMDRLIALGEIGLMGPDAAAAVPAVIGLLDDPDPRVRGKSAEALGGIGPAASAGVKTLMRLVEDADPGVRIDAAYALWRIGSPVAPSVGTLRRGLQDSDWLVQARAAGLLGFIGPQASEAVPDLLVALTRVTVARGSEAPVLDLDASPPQLRSPKAPAEQLDRAAAVRAAAAGALGSIGARESTAALENASTHDPDPDVRASARKALQLLRSRRTR